MIESISLKELSDALADNKITALEIADFCLKRIDEADGTINAFISVGKERLRDRARESDLRRSRGEELSPYDGMPVAVKDNILTEGVATTCGSRMLEDFIPPYSATAVAKLAETGFLLLGKTNCDEFAMGSTTETSHFGPTRNPRNMEKVPGGSSGGSAAAVAAGMVPVSLGSDTGGSIRQPAAFCGVVGIKPTYGRVSRYGLVAHASSLDQIGTFAGNVDDAALLLSIISGGDRRDSTSVDAACDFTPDKLDGDVRGLRIGVPDEYFRGVAPEICDIVNDRIKALAGRGAVITPVSLLYTEYAMPVYYIISTAEASSNLARYDGARYGHSIQNPESLSDLYFLSRSEGFGKEVKRRIILGTFSLSSGYYEDYYRKALKVRRLIADDFKKAFAGADVVMAPVTATTAFRLGEMMDDPLQMYKSDALTVSANLAGIPALSVPAGIDRSGLPVGLQIMGNHFCEKTILNAAKAVERIRGMVAANQAVPMESARTGPPDGAAL